MKYDTLVVEYNGKQYSLLKHPFIFKGCESYTIDSQKSEIKKISMFEESPTELKLSLGALCCEIDATDNISFYETYDNIIVIDKTTQKPISGEKLDNDTGISYLKLNDTMMFIDAIISLNVNVHNYLNTFPKFIGDNLNFNYWGNRVFTLNFFNMCIFNLPEFEKLINSNNIKFLETNLKEANFELSDASKLHQIVGLPKFAIQLIKEYKLEEYSLDLKAVADVLDGNSFKIFLDFLGNMKLVLKSQEKERSRYQRTPDFKKFFENCAFILDKKRGYKITDFLNYLLRQTMYFRDSKNLTFPMDEAMYLRDYIEMCENYGLKYEKYPAKVKRSHNLTAKNINSLQNASPEVEEKFEEAVLCYSEVERIVKYIKDPKKPEEAIEYAFIVPHDIKALIQEGNDMHHCVGSYTNKIIDGKARVVFMRLASKKNESLITIDIDEHYNLVEATKAYNEPVDDDQMKAINKWLREVKKAKSV